MTAPKKPRSVRSRIAAAWNCLRGRPTVAFCTFAGPLVFDSARNGLVVGNTIRGNDTAWQWSTFDRVVPGD